MINLRKKIGMIFQSSALFDSMDVFENVAFALREHTKLSEYEILKIVKRLREIDSQCKIEILTNGYGSRVNKVLSILPDWVNVINSNKTSNRSRFFSYNIAPIDLEDYQNANFIERCWITHDSGLGLTRYGYYPCGAGASADRVFGFDIGQKELSSINDSISLSIEPIKDE